MADENTVDELDESGNPIVFFDVALGGETLHPLHPSNRFVSVVSSQTCS